MCIVCLSTCLLTFVSIFKPDDTVTNPDVNIKLLKVNSFMFFDCYEEQGECANM